MSRNKELENEYEELANDHDDDCDFVKAMQIIAKNLFVCVEELKDAGCRYSDFSDNE